MCLSEKLKTYFLQQRVIQGQFCLIKEYLHEMKLSWKKGWTDSRTNLSMIVSKKTFPFCYFLWKLQFYDKTKPKSL